MVEINKQETNMERDCRNVVELEENMEVVTELTVKKISSEDIKRLINSDLMEFDHGCDIKTCIENYIYKELPLDDRFQGLPVVAVKTPLDKEPYYINAPLCEVEFTAMVINLLIPRFLEYNMNCEFIELDDCWSINPSSCYC